MEKWLNTASLLSHLHKISIQPPGILATAEVNIHVCDATRDVNVQKEVGENKEVGRSGQDEQPVHSFIHQHKMWMYWKTRCYTEEVILTCMTANYTADNLRFH